MKGFIAAGGAYVAAVALLARAPTMGQERLSGGSFEGLLRQNADKVVETGVPVGIPISRAASMKRLVNAWNDLVEQLRRSQTSFSEDESHELDAVLRHIQRGLLAIGVKAKGSTEVTDPVREAGHLAPHTSALRAFLARKYTENREVRAFRKLWTHARKLDEEARMLSPTVAASDLRR